MNWLVQLEFMDSAGDQIVPSSYYSVMQVIVVVWDLDDVSAYISFMKTLAVVTWNCGEEMEDW